MINKENNTIKCNHCNIVETINKTKLKKWTTRQYVEKLNKENKHYCNKCSNMLGFYINGVIIY